MLSKLFHISFCNSQYFWLQSLLKRSLVGPTIFEKWRYIIGNDDVLIENLKSNYFIWAGSLLGQNDIWARYIWAISFGPESTFGPRTFRPEGIFGPGTFGPEGTFGPGTFRPEGTFGSGYFWARRYFWARDNSARRYFWARVLLGQGTFGPRYFWAKVLLGQGTFGPKVRYIWLSQHTNGQQFCEISTLRCLKWLYRFQPFMSKIWYQLPWYQYNMH